MKITVLSENTISEKNKNLALKEEHGLSLHIQEKKNILFDMGQTNLFESNAKKLNIDIANVDYGILSHGHYDHGGLSSTNQDNGIVCFLNKNTKADLFLSRDAFQENYNGKEKYIGLDKNILENKNYLSRMKFLDGDFQLEDNIKILSAKNKQSSYIIRTYGLCQKLNNSFVPENFNHEQYLLIDSNNKKILFSSCSHKGILNILEWFTPDIFIGGFHFKDLNLSIPEDEKYLVECTKKMMEYKTQFFTCHCTGTNQFEFLKKIMKEKLEYISCGDIIDL